MLRITITTRPEGVKGRGALDPDHLHGPRPRDHARTLEQTFTALLAILPSA
jgi:hypothetical protein